MSDGHIDRVIDEIARELTDGAPDPRFRARVLDRLQAPRRPRWPLWILAPAAVAAAVAIVVFVARQNHRSPMEFSRQAEARRPDVTIAPPTSTLHPLSPEHPAPNTPHADGYALPLDASTPSELAPAPLDIPRIGLERVELTAIEPAPSIESDPLEAIAPLAIARLDDLKGDRQ